MRVREGKGGERRKKEEKRKKKTDTDTGTRGTNELQGLCKTVAVMQRCVSSIEPGPERHSGQSLRLYTQRSASLQPHTRLPCGYASR